MTQEQLALPISFVKRIMTLADDVIVYPAHGAGSAWEKHEQGNRFYHWRSKAT
jgi:hypothetical protein